MSLLPHELPPCRRTAAQSGGGAPRTHGHMSRAAARMPRVCLTLFIGLLLCTGVCVHSPPAMGFTLQEARAQALKVYWGVKIAQEEVAMAKAERKSRFSNFFPQLAFNSNYTHYNDETDFRVSKGAVATNPVPIPTNDLFLPWLNQNTYQYGPTLLQPIFAGGRLYFGYLQSQALEAQSQWDEKKMVNNLLSQVETVYVDILELHGEAAVMEDTLKFFKQHRQDMEDKYKAGRVAIVDLLKAEAQESETEEQLLTVNSNLKVDEAHLNQLLGQPVSAVLELAPLPDPSPVTIDLDTAWKLARSYRPEMQAAIAQSNAAGYSKRVVESSYYPQVNFTGKWYGQEASPSNPETERWQLLLTADWNLWDWGGTTQQVEKMAAQQREAEDQVYLTSDEVNLEVYLAWLQIKTADLKVEAIGRQKTHALEVVRVANLGFNAGVATSTELMAAETMLSQVEIDEVKARFGAQLARTSFYHAIGIMDEQLAVSTAPPLQEPGPTPHP